MHAAGNSLEVIGDLVGHSSASMTEMYRHLIVGEELEAARRFDEYLSRNGNGNGNGNGREG
jgi:hypothetical protein